MELLQQNSNRYTIKSLGGLNVPINTSEVLTQGPAHCKYYLDANLHYSATAVITSMMFLCPKACDWRWESKDKQSTENTALALPSAQPGGNYMTRKSASMGTVKPYCRQFN